MRPGDKIKVEKLDALEGSEVIFDSVLLVADKDTLVGSPFVAGYTTKAKVLRQGKGKKIIVYKYKPKKRYHKKQGHRQRYTEVEILSIGKGGESKSEGKKVVKKASNEKAAKSTEKRAAAVAKKKVPSAKAKAADGKKAA